MPRYGLAIDSAIFSNAAAILLCDSQEAATYASKEVAIFSTELLMALNSLFVASWAASKVDAALSYGVLLLLALFFFCSAFKAAKIVSL